MSSNRASIWSEECASRYGWESILRPPDRAVQAALLGAKVRDVWMNDWLSGVGFDDPHFLNRISEAS
jgi:hypothetical protein